MTTYQCIVQDTIVLIVSLKQKLIHIFLFYFLVSSGVPIVPFIPKKLSNTKEETQNDDKGNLNTNKEKEKNDNINRTTENKKDEKMLQTVFVPTSLIINPIIKAPKIINNKYPKKKMKPFSERSGDWICQKCKNLNFAFRHECNRCKFPKKESMDETETQEKKKENNNDNIISEKNNNGNKNYSYYNNGQQCNFKKNKYRHKKYSYNGY